MANNKQIIFEIVSGADFKHYKIYADGSVEGFDSPVYVENNLPILEGLLKFQKKSSGEPSPPSALTIFREGLLQIDAE